jgi:ubiquitin carboxyl-terminal hydrolase 7
MNNEEDYRYSLHSVVVHKGTVNQGHYFAFIKPEVDGKWYMFNDEIVREADEHEVFEFNYGGANKIYRHKDRGNIVEIPQRADANAYILVYIKKTSENLILDKISEGDVKSIFNI